MSQFEKNSKYSRCRNLSQTQGTAYVGIWVKLKVQQVSQFEWKWKYSPSWNLSESKITAFYIGIWIKLKVQSMLEFESDSKYSLCWNLSQTLNTAHVNLSLTKIKVNVGIWVWLKGATRVEYLIILKLQLKSKLGTHLKYKVQLESERSQTPSSAGFEILDLMYNCRRNWRFF